MKWDEPDKQGGSSMSAMLALIERQHAEETDASSRVDAMIESQQLLVTALRRLIETQAEQREDLQHLAQVIGTLAVFVRDTPEPVVNLNPNFAVDAGGVYPNIEVAVPPADVTVRSPMPKGVKKTVHRDADGLIDYVTEDWMY
jgi:hypothetical protein